MGGRDPMQSFYAARPKTTPSVRSDAIRNYRSLSLVATAFVVLGGLVAVLGIIAVFIAAANQAQVDSDSAFLGAVVGLIFVVLIAAFYVAMGQLLNLMIDLQDNTHRTAMAIEAVDETLDDIQELLERRGPPKPS